MKFVLAVILFFAVIVQLSVALKPYVTTCSTCKGDICALYVVDKQTDSYHYPCYQGTPDAVARLDDYSNPKGGYTFWCSDCKSLGYADYWKNDPVYKTVELWVNEEKNLRGKDQ